MTELNPPPGGWTLPEAAAALLPDIYAPAAKQPPKDWWMAGGAEAHKKERDAFRLAFSRLMEGGGYAADGVAEGDAEPSPISPQVWRAAQFQLGFPGEPNLPAELVASGGRWRGVRVTMAEAGLSAGRAEVQHPPSAPPLSDLPEWWTLTQASVWIALRDTAAVRDAAPSHHGKNTRGVVGWHVDWAWRRSEGAAVGPDPGAADELLEAAARRGAIRGRGKPHTSENQRAIESYDWTLVTIAEDQRERGAKYLCPARGDGSHWRGVVVARDDVAREWPPFDVAEQEPVPDPACPVELPKKSNASADREAATPAAQSGASRPMLNPRLAPHEYQLRVARWKLAQQETPNLRAPTGRDDTAWAIDRFGSLPRTLLRRLRNKYAPAAWQKAGKRAGPIWRD